MCVCVCVRVCVYCVCGGGGGWVYGRNSRNGRKWQEARDLDQLCSLAAPTGRSSFCGPLPDFAQHYHHQHVAVQPAVANIGNSWPRATPRIPSLFFTQLRARTDAAAEVVLQPLARIRVVSVIWLVRGLGLLTGCVRLAGLAPACGVADGGVLRVRQG